MAIVYVKRSEPGQYDIYVDIFADESGRNAWGKVGTIVRGESLRTLGRDRGALPAHRSEWHVIDGTLGYAIHADDTLQGCKNAAETYFARFAHCSRCGFGRHLNSRSLCDVCVQADIKAERLASRTTTELLTGFLECAGGCGKVSFDILAEKTMCTDCEKAESAPVSKLPVCPRCLEHVTALDSDGFCFRDCTAPDPEPAYPGNSCHHGDNLQYQNCATCRAWIDGMWREHDRLLILQDAASFSQDSPAQVAADLREEIDSEPASDAPRFTVPCPDCGESFDVEDPALWENVRDHRCAAISEGSGMPMYDDTEWTDAQRSAWVCFGELPDGAVPMNSR